MFRDLLDSILDKAGYIKVSDFNDKLPNRYSGLGAWAGQEQLPPASPNPDQRPEFTGRQDMTSNRNPMTKQVPQPATGKGRLGQDEANQPISVGTRPDLR